MRVATSSVDQAKAAQQVSSAPQRRIRINADARVKPALLGSLRRILVGSITPRAESSDITGQQTRPTVPYRTLQRVESRSAGAVKTESPVFAARSGAPDSRRQPR